MDNVINLLNYFDKVYCINLKKRPDRWLETQAELNKYNICGVTRYEAIDGNELHTPNHISPGAFGLIETFKKIIMDACENKYAKILILEDDIFFKPEISNLDEYMRLLPDDYSMFYLGGHHICKPIYINDKIVLVNQMFTTHSIAIKQGLYDLILNDIHNLTEPIDVYFTKLQKQYKVYSFLPNLTGQRPSFSDIEGRDVDYTDGMDEYI
jgi:hypothetical protein